MFEKPTPEDLRTWMGGNANAPEIKLTMAVEVACDLMDEALGSASEMPQALYTYAVLQVAHGVFKRSSTTSGAQAIGLDGEAGVAYDPKDELNRVWHLIRRYSSPFPAPRDEASWTY
jgi:hypothetical protein